MLPSGSLTSPSELVIRLPKMHEAQRRVHLEQRRFNVLCMGRRWGKTTMGVRLIKGCLHGHSIGWCAPQYKLLDEAWREIVRRYLPAIQRSDSQQKRLEFQGGGSLDFWTLDRPEAVGRGRAYHSLIIDEAAMVGDLETAWTESLRPTLTDHAGTAWFLSTPKGLNYFHELFRRAEPDWMSWQMPSATNPHLDPAEIEAARLELPSIAYQQEYLAEFVEGSGARIKREWIKHSPPPTGLELVMAVDLAISTKSDADYSAAVVLGRHANGNIYIVAAEHTRAPFSGVLQFIQAIHARYRPSQIVIEQVQYQAAVVQELLRTTTLPVRGVHPDRDKLTRFMPLEARYEQGLIYHSPGLGAYEDELLAFPVGQHDDLVDAAAYAYAAIAAPKTSPQTLRRIGAMI